MAVAAASWITLAQLKVYAGITTTDATRDTMLEGIIDSVSVELCRFVGREISKTTYTAVYLDGNGEKDLLLPHYPVVSITSLAENSVSLTEGLTYDYLLYAAEGRLHRIYGGWLNWPKILLITYVAGYVVQGATPGAGETALPLDLKMACQMQCAFEWKKSQQKNWGIASITTPDGSISKNETGSILKAVQDKLSGHKVMQ